VVNLFIRNNFVEINSRKRNEYVIKPFLFSMKLSISLRVSMSTESCGHTTKWRAPWRQLGKEILKFVKIKIMCFVIAEKSTSPSHCSPTPIIPLTTLLHPAPHLLCLSQTPTPPLPTTETTSSQSCFTPTI
jgi:hypothetical protein